MPRLALLAQVHEAGTRALLARWCPPAPDHAVDLGCGPGHSTLLLHRASGARRTTGVTPSAAHAAAARDLVAGLGLAPWPGAGDGPNAGPGGIAVVEADVVRDPLPVGPADVVHARFLLPHVPARRAAVRLWGDLLRPGGRLVLQEVARLVSREPALGRYYELVAELQEHRGEGMDVGHDLGAVVTDAASPASGLVVEHVGVRAWNPPLVPMATLHVLSLRSWRADPFAARAFDPDELDALDEALSAIAHGAASEPIEQELGEAVLTRP